MSEMSFDKTINLGHVITIGGVIAAGLGIMFTLRADINQIAFEAKSLNDKITSIENKVDKVTDVLITLGKQEVRLDSLEKRLLSLERPVVEVPVQPRGGGRVR